MVAPKIWQYKRRKYAPFIHPHRRRKFVPFIPFHKRRRRIKRVPSLEQRVHRLEVQFMGLEIALRALGLKDRIPPGVDSNVSSGRQAPEEPKNVSEGLSESQIKAIREAVRREADRAGELWPLGRKTPQKDPKIGESEEKDLDFDK